VLSMATKLVGLVALVVVVSSIGFSLVAATV
jgi:hypothetical protein